MKKTRYLDRTKTALAIGLQPGEDYGEAEECHTNISQHTHLGYAFEVYFDEMAGPLSQWKAFCVGVGSRSGLERDEVITAMEQAIAQKYPGNNGQNPQI